MFNSFLFTFLKLFQANFPVTYKSTKKKRLDYTMNKNILET
jgi:hypothetical protein